LEITAAQGRREKYRHDTDVKTITHRRLSNKEPWARSNEMRCGTALPFWVGRV